MPTYSAIKVDVEFKRLFSWCEDDIRKIIEVLTPHPHDIRKGMHTEKTLSLIFVSHMTPKQLIARLNSLLAELNSVNNVWCSECPRTIIGINGPLDPASVAAEDAWRRADFLTETNNVQYANWWQGGV
jgi:hypothetical protein